MLWDSSSSRWVISGPSNIGGGIVKPALALYSEEAGLLRRHVGRERPRGVHVPDGHVSPLPKRMVGEVVLGQVAVHVAVRPVDDRQDLCPPVLAADDRKVLPRARLRAPEPREPRARAAPRD